jgi:hypothetical protein
MTISDWSANTLLTWLIALGLFGVFGGLRPGVEFPIEIKAH